MSEPRIIIDNNGTFHVEENEEAAEIKVAVKSEKKIVKKSPQGNKKTAPTEERLQGKHLTETSLHKGVVSAS